MRRILSILLLSLTLAACVSGEAFAPTDQPSTEAAATLTASPTPDLVSAGTFVLGTPFWIEMDQTVSQQDGALQLTFLDAPEDGRCPVGTNINCAWEGQVTVLLQAARGDTSGEVSLTIPGLRRGVAHAVLFDLYTVNLLAVEPKPTSLDPIERSAYRAQIMVTEGLPTATPSPETFALGTPFWIEMDSTLVQQDGSLRLFFLDVPEDERCPVGSNINCEEAGQVTVWLQAALGDRAGEAWLTIPDLNRGVASAGLFDLYTVELLAVEPQRTSLDRIERSAYRAQLIVTEGAPSVTPATPAPASE